MANDTAGKLAEYLIFFPDEGDFEVSVRFKKSGARISNRRASADDVAKLLDMLTRSPKPAMYFDEHYGVVDAVRVNPGKRAVRLEVTFSDVV